MLTATLLALAMLAGDPAPAAMLFPWETVTPVRYHRRHRHHYRRYRSYRPAEAAPPDCAKINDAARGLTQDEIADAIRNKPRQQEVYEQCQKRR